MAGISILLDTNIISSLMAIDQDLAVKVDAAEKVFVSAISLGELYYGAYHSPKVDQYLKAIRSVEDLYISLTIDRFTSIHYGEIKSRLKLKGKPIPENDIWISALARQHNLILISRDHHFGEVEGLSWEVW